MKWYEVGVQCDGYTSIYRFRTEPEALQWEESYNTDSYDGYAEFLGEVDTESKDFFTELENDE